MSETKFLICEHCKNLVGVIHDAGMPLVCCGEVMEPLTAKTADAGREKHLPVVTVEGNCVRAACGEVAHPMTEEHSIAWMYLLTNRGGQRKALAPTDAPAVTFALAEGEKPLAVYAYCNLHGLWMSEVK